MSFLLDEIPGVKVIEDVLTQLDDLAKEVTKLWGVVSGFNGPELMTALVTHAHRAVNLVGGITNADYKWIQRNVGGTIFHTMLHEALDLNAGKIEREAPGSVSVIDTLIAFSLTMPAAFAGVTAILKMFGGQRVSETAGHLFGKIPEEMGINWAIGMFLDRALEAAVGNKFEEAIMRQKLPNAPDWRIVRLMVTKKLISETDLMERIHSMGFGPPWDDKLRVLGETFIPLGDLQQLYLDGKYERPDVLTGLKLLGFADDDAETLTSMYIDRAQTQAGVMLRSTARQLVLSQLIDPKTYLGYLEQTNLPQREVVDDLRAIQLELEHGRLREPVSVIKTRYEHGELVPDEARTALTQLGYTPDAIDAMFKAWDEGKLPHPMSAAKVLTYWYSGVLTDKTDVVNRLMATGLRNVDAIFLRDHPPAGGAKKHQLTPALVVQGFLDGVIDQSGLLSTLKLAGADESAAEYLEQIAIFRKSRQRRPAHATVPLTAGEIREAFKNGIFDPSTAQMELEKLGYSADDALTLLEITNKGYNPFAKGGAPAFADLGSAIAYMAAHGYTVIPPPDPMLTAAEAMLSAAGYSWTGGGSGIANVGVPPYPGGLPGAGGGGQLIPPGTIGPGPGSGIPPPTAPPTAPPGPGPLPPG